MPPTASAPVAAKSATFRGGSCAGFPALICAIVGYSRAAAPTTGATTGGMDACEGFAEAQLSACSGSSIERRALGGVNGGSGWVGLAAVWIRWAGSFSRQRRTIAASEAGTSGRYVDSKGGVLKMMLAQVAI